MAINFDVFANNARSVLRGEAVGSVRFLVLALLALGVWVAASWVGDWANGASSSLSAQEGRYRTLSMLAAEYKALGAGRTSAPAEAVDIPTVFTQVSERMELGSRVNRLSPEGRNQSIVINRLYAEELEELIRELAARGVRFLSAELRALPSGEERLFSLSAIIGRIGEGAER